VRFVGITTIAWTNVDRYPLTDFKRTCWYMFVFRDTSDAFVRVSARLNRPGLVGPLFYPAYNCSSTLPIRSTPAAVGGSRMSWR
jgi:hypothetical protein